jgi:hypothetical protein
MRTLWKHRGLVALLALLVTLGAGLLPASNARAAVGSSYSYIVDGEELAVGYDPLSVKSGLLLPEELLRSLGILVRSGDSSSIELSRGSLQAALKVGSQLAVANGEKITLATAPIRANGQLYLPEGILTHLGVKMSNEGNLLLINRWPLADSAETGDYAALVQTNTAKSYYEVTRSVAMTLNLTKLTPEIVKHPSWTSNPALRGQALKLLEGNVLIEVGVHNELSNFYQFKPSDLVLVDDLGNQYAATEIINVKGDIASPLAPTAKARGIMVFPAPASGSQSFKIYSTTNLYALASWSVK